MAHFVRAIFSGTVAVCQASQDGGPAKVLASKHVVIVGGGYAGTALANKLKGKCKFTLIDPKDCFHHNLGALRSCTEKGYAIQSFVPYQPAYGDNFKRGEVVKTDAAGKKVVLKGGEEIPYDYLVLATGTTGYFPCKLDLSLTDVPKVIQMYDGVVEKIKAANDIVIIGGGPAGIELSGEIVTDMKDKKVTLIHSRAELINNAPSLTEQFRKCLLEKLVQHGVNVLLEQRVTNLSELPKDELRRCTVRTDKGKEVDADLVFVCTGLKINTSAYSSTLADKMDNIGCLSVDENLRVKGTSDVFAIGDCSTADAQAKMAFKAGTHANLVAQNIQLDVEGKALKPYKPPGAMMCVPIGRNAGVTQTGSWVWGDFLSRNLKGKGLFTTRYWKDMQQTMPATAPTK